MHGLRLFAMELVRRLRTSVSQKSILQNIKRGSSIRDSFCIFEGRTAGEKVGRWPLAVGEIGSLAHAIVKPSKRTKTFAIDVAGLANDMIMAVELFTM